MDIKGRYKSKMLQFWGNPDNDFIIRKRMHLEVLKISAKTFYKHFTPTEMSEIENEAESMRRKNTARKRSKVLDSLHRRAVGYSHLDTHISTFMGSVEKTTVIRKYPPDPVAAREYLDRTEGKVPDKIDHTIRPGEGVEIEIEIKGS